MVFINTKMYTIMRYLNSADFKKIIQESINEMFNEAGMMPPKPLSAPKPLNAPSPIGAPKPIGAPSGAASSTAISQTPSDPKPFKGGPTKNGIRVGVSDAKYENFYETQDPNEVDKEVFKIWIDYVNDIHAQRWTELLNKKFGDILYAIKIAKPKSGKASGFTYLIKICSRPEKLNDFIAAIPEIVDSLYTMPSVKNRMTGVSISYDPTFKDELIQRIQDFVKKSVSQEDMEEMYINVADNVTDLLSDLKNPATINKLRGISGMIMSSANQRISNEVNGDNVKGDNGKSAGHQLSMRNKAEIFVQDPNATFVTQDFVWRNVFNHEVIDPNKFILVRVPSNNKTVTKDDRDSAAKRAGYTGGYDEFKALKKRGEVQGGEEHAVRMGAKLHASGTPVFSYIKMYDVANTRPIPGMKSKFYPGPDQERNLENNLLGIPNAAAKSMVSNVPVTPPQTDNSGTTNENIGLVCDSLVAIVKRNIGTAGPQLTGDPNRDIVNYAYAYAKYLLSAAFQGISKPETQEAFCQGFAAGVAYSLGVTDSQAADYLSRAVNNRGKDSTLKQLIYQWFNEYVELITDIEKDVYKKLKQMKPSKKVVEEEINENGIGNQLGIDIMSFDEFCNFMGVDDEQQIYEEQDDNITTESLKESFFKFLDKMDLYD